MDKVLFASLDLSKPADLAKWQGHVAKRQAEVATPEDQLKLAQAELAKAQEKLAKLAKTSTVPTEPAPAPAPEGQREGLSKSESDQWKAGAAVIRKLSLSKNPTK
jgi:hypothetical protein